MVEYFIKSFGYMAVLYLGSRVLLNNVRAFRFKRAILLISVVFSLSMPLFHFSLPISPSRKHVALKIVDTAIFTVKSFSEDLNFPRQDMPLPMILMIGYGLVVLMLLVRYLRNLRILVFKNIGATKENYLGNRVVFLDKATHSYTFFNTIFLCRADVENGVLDENVLMHEIAHKKQLHSLDVLLMELLQAVFWINPFVPLFSKLIRANHEFMADQFVIRQGVSRSAYVKKLFQITFRDRPLTLVSSFDNQLIKRRFIMLSKQEQKRGSICQISVFLMIFSFLLSATVLSSESGAILNMNPTDHCLVKYHVGPIKSGYTINGNERSLFSHLNGKYLVPQESIACTLSEDNSKTVFKLNHYEYYEENGQIFIDGKRVGSVQKGDFIILHHEKRVDVFSHDRVTFVK